MKCAVARFALIGLTLFIAAWAGIVFGPPGGHGDNWGIELMFSAFPIFWYASGVFKALDKSEPGVATVLVPVTLAMLQFSFIGSAAYWTKANTDRKGRRRSFAIGLICFGLLLIHNPSSIKGFFAYGYAPPLVFPLMPTEFPRLRLAVDVLFAERAQNLSALVYLFWYGALATTHFLFYGAVVQRFFKKPPAR